MSSSAMTGDASRQGAFSRRFTTPLFMGSALNPLNNSFIATALVPIAAAMHVSIGRTTALISGLYLACAIAQPTAGKLADAFGPRRVFIAGILTVLLGGVVGGGAHTLTTLIIARVLIGLGTSAGYPSAMLLVRRRAESAGLAAPPGGVLGGLVVTGSAVAALGLPVGGALVGAWGWRTVFLINVPVALLTLALAVFWLPVDPAGETPRTLREISRRIDAVGIAGFGGAMAALMVFLMALPRPQWVALALAVVLASGFVAWERRVRRPFLDVRLLVTNLALTRTYLRFAMATLCTYTALYGLTQWLEAARGSPAREAGLLLLPMNALSAIIARAVARRNLVRAPLLVAALSCLVASAGVLLLTGRAPILWVAVITLIFGITLGTTLSANQTTLYSQVSSDQIATASGLFRTFGYVGSMASAALIAIAFHAGVSEPGLHGIGWTMVVASAVGLLLVVADRGLLRQIRVERILSATPQAGLHAAASAGAGRP